MSEYKSANCLAVEVLGITQQECEGPHQDLSRLVGQSVCGACINPCRQVLKVQAKRAGVLRNQNAKLEHQAETDHLTKLLNRRAFDRQLDKRISKGEPFVLVMIDVIKFGMTNVREGHLAGDFYLTHTADYLDSSVREDDDQITCRFGGDEFAIFLNARRRSDGETLSEEDLRKIQHRIPEGYLESDVVKEYNQKWITDKLGLKVGIGLWTPPMPGEDFVKSVDPKGL